MRDTEAGGSPCVPHQPKYIVPAKSYTASSCLNSKTKNERDKREEKMEERREEERSKCPFRLYWEAKLAQPWRASARRAQLSPAPPQLGRRRLTASFFLLSVSHLCTERLRSPLWCINFVIPGQGIEMERGYDKLEPPLLADAQPRLCCAVRSSRLRFNSLPA